MRLFGGSHAAAATPNKVNRDARESDQIAYTGRSGREDREVNDQEKREKSKYDRRNRITPGLVRPDKIGPAVTQNNNGENGQRTENKLDRNDVFEQLCVNIAKYGSCRLRSIRDGSRNNKQRRPNALSRK